MSVFLAAGCVFSEGGLQGWDAWRWVRFYVVVVFLPRGVFSKWGGLQGWDARLWVRFCDVGVFWPRCVFSWEVYKVGMRGSRGKLGQVGRNLCAGSGEIPKTLEKAVEGIALRGGFGL